MKKVITILLSFILLLGSIGFAQDKKMSITKGDVTVSYYQEGVKDKKTNERINQKSGNEFLKNTKEGIQVKTKNKTTLFYTPFSKHNREVAKKAGDTNFMDGDIHGFTMEMGMRGFGNFIELSPRSKYVTYQINNFYDAIDYYLMDIRDGSHPLQWNTHGGHDIGGKRQPSGERFFYIEQDELKYTISGKFPESKVLVKHVNSIKNITFDKNYIYITDRKKAFDNNSGVYTMKFKLSNLK